MINLTVGLIVAIVSVFSTWYLSDVYNRPKILYYSRPYYKVSDIAIGNMFLWNAGRKTDRNIAVTFSTALKDEEIKIVDLVSPYKILHNDNKTSIVISELQPGESADITFKDDSVKDDSDITNFTSEYSNIYEMPFAFQPAWWQSSIIAVALPSVFFCIGIIGGFFLKRKRTVA